MADVKPLKLEFDGNGDPSGIAEFQSGDTIEGNIVDISLSEVTDVSSTLNPVAGDNLVWNGSTWTASADAGPGSTPALSGLTDTSFTDVTTHQHIQWDGSQWINAYEDEQYFQIRNETGSTLTKGQAIFVSGSHTEDIVLIGLAKADSSATMPSIGLVSENVANNTEGLAVTFGKAKGLALASPTYSEGDTVYISPTTAGDITNTKPTGTTELIQNIGIVTKTHASNGAIKVTGVGRANDIPNAVVATEPSSIDYIYGDDGGVFTKIVPSSLNSFMWIRSTVDGTAAIEQYWGSGTGDLTVNESGFPNASSTLFNDGYVEIPYDGVYLIYAKIGLNVTVSPTTISLIIITTTGFGGVESTLGMGTQVIRTNIDPHQGVVDYMGSFTAGTKVAVKLLANGTNTVKPERFASVRFQKIG